MADFEAELWLYPGDVGWCFLTLPLDLSDDLREQTDGRRAGDDRYFFATLPTVIEDESAALELAVALRDGAQAGLRVELLHSGVRDRDAA